MKKSVKLCIATLSLSAVAGLAQAAVPGGYVGLGLGGSKLDTPNSYLVTGDDAQYFDQSRQRSGLAGRLFAGYNFNPYIGLEAGLAQYAPAKYKSTAADIAEISAKEYMTALDVVAKAYLPLGDTGANLYVLGGAAVVRNEAKVDASFLGDTAHYSANKTQVKPIAGLGANYNIPNTQLTAGVEYSHIFGSSNGPTPNADLMTVNLAYNFG